MTCNDIIRDQEENGIEEKVDEKSHCKNNDYYMPYKAVEREAAQTTKIRIVYDESAKSSSKNVSLNEWLETGPPWQNLIWDILTRLRFRPVLFCGLIGKAFLQIDIREPERDILRFHWVDSLESKIIDSLESKIYKVSFRFNTVSFHLGRYTKEAFWELQR